MKTYCQHRELYSVLCGDLSGKEIWKRGDLCIHIADSLCCTVETNTTLLSTYTLTSFFKRQQTPRNSRHTKHYTSFVDDRYVDKVQTYAREFYN